MVIKLHIFYVYPLHQCFPVHQQISLEAQKTWVYNIFNKIRGAEIKKNFKKHITKNKKNKKTTTTSASQF
jgi:hypothetical protein